MCSCLSVIEYFTTGRRGVRSIRRVARVLIVEEPTHHHRSLLRQPAHPHSLPLTHTVDTPVTNTARDDNVCVINMVINIYFF